MRWMRQIKIRLREAPRVLVRRTGRSCGPRAASYVGGQATALALEAGADEVLKKPLLARELDISLDRTGTDPKVTALVYVAARAPGA